MPVANFIIMLIRRVTKKIAKGAKTAARQSPKNTSWGESVLFSLHFISYTQIYPRIIGPIIKSAKMKRAEDKRRT